MECDKNVGFKVRKLPLIFAIVVLAQSAVFAERMCAQSTSKTATPKPATIRPLGDRLNLPLLERMDFRSEYSNAPVMSDEADTQAINEEDETMSDQGNYNLKLPTLGGKQVWTDHQWWNGWRIQNNLITGHWRLIDDRNFRHAWGSREACEAELERATKANPEPAPDKVVILLHGLMRSSDSMHSLGKFLQENGFPTVVEFGYASTRSSIAEHAVALREVIEKLPGKPELYFSGHSMGNIVLRHAIGDWQKQGDTEILNRIKSVVMLGPPNQGAAMAKRMAKTGIFGIVTGKAGLELGPAWDQLEQELGTPPCRFGIVMGNIESWSKFNPLLEGPSDLIVTVEEAKLDGATEMLSVPDLHSFLMDDKNVQAAVVRFFKGETLAEKSGEPVEAKNNAEVESKTKN